MSFEGKMESGPAERVKSPEEKRFDALLEDARHRSLEGDYTFADSPADEEAVHRESLRGAYYESGDPAKMAMFVLQEAWLELDGLIGILRIPDPENKSRKEIIERLSPVLLELGLAIPQTRDEAKALKDKIVSFENFLKISERIKAGSKK